METNKRCKLINKWEIISKKSVLEMQFARLSNNNHYYKFKIWN